MKSKSTTWLELDIRYQGGAWVANLRFYQCSVNTGGLGIIACQDCSITIFVRIIEEMERLTDRIV